MKDSPQHCQMSQFKSADNQLVINGVKLNDIVNRVGQTPFYAYDRSIIKNNIDNFNRHFAGIASLHYAIKCNPMPALVDYISPMVDGLDVASGQELTTALNSGHNAKEISFAGPGKQPKELLMALAAGITINIESERELERIFHLSKQYDYRPNIAVRVNPDFELKSSGMKMGGGSQQFGIDAERVPEVIKVILKNNANFKGFHIYTGSQNLKAESIITAHNAIFDLAVKLSRQSNTSLEQLNIGGGFGIPYFPGEQPLELDEIANNLKRLIATHADDLSGSEIIIELGRYLVGNSGIFVSRVIDIKQSRGQKYVVIDGGMHHQLAASGNFGQVIRKNYPVAVGNRMDQTAIESVNIVGPLCTPLDILASKYNLPHIEVDDLVVVYQSGAYGFTASPKDFLSHPYPIEVLI
ncbi:MAG: pyridoxal-dependent decarboxylase, exosortase A system-associated [Kangiellaceae bacterium]|jgi:diaminopimelate decarboxylase|nr:pyridoxal-dependent decarboxylase, exosortase A system-associated [Kangiellaceae bacterium]